MKPKAKKSPGVLFGPASLERVPPHEQAKARAAAAPPNKLVAVPRCPLCRTRAATEVVELGLVHVKVCATCGGNVHTALRVFGALKTLL